ncbi:MAG: hypothetical protein U0794_13685 [Isosphaeraceae bacterium]
MNLETLEGRALLSSFGGRIAARAAAAAEVSQPHVSTLIPGPIRNLVGPGYAVKSPRFYERFAGPPLNELSVAGAKAQLDGTGSLTLTGIVTANEIPEATEPGSTPLFYMWGIDRGGSPIPGPIPGRPHITFDTLVAVGITDLGISASVIDVASGQATPLPSSNVLLKQNAVQVVVPGISGTSATAVSRRNVSGMTVSFFTSTAAPDTAGIESIAAFAPEFRNFPVKVTNAIAIPLATRFRR